MWTLETMHCVVWWLSCSLKILRNLGHYTGKKRFSHINEKKRGILMVKLLIVLMLLVLLSCFIIIKWLLWHNYVHILQHRAVVYDKVKNFEKESLKTFFLSHYSIISSCLFVFCNIILIILQRCIKLVDESTHT